MHYAKISFSLFFLFFFSISSSQPQIESSIPISIPPLRDCLQQNQFSWSIVKNTFFSLSSFSSSLHFATFNACVNLLKSQHVSLLSNSNGLSLSFPPSNYLSSLRRSCNDLYALNEMIALEFGL
jgi:hypothetical protein